MAAVGVVFGVVIAKEVFGGTALSLNPALTGRAFLYFAYPAQMSGDAVWVAVDGWTQATPLVTLRWVSIMALTGCRPLSALLPGSVGETSTLAILIAGVCLSITHRLLAGDGRRVARHGPDVIIFQSSAIKQPNVCDAVLLALGLGRIRLRGAMATDPVSAAMTNNGRWFYGVLIGFMCVLIRVVNPAFPEA